MKPEQLCPYIHKNGEVTMWIDNGKMIVFTNPLTGKPTQVLGTYLYPTEGMPFHQFKSLVSQLGDETEASAYQLTQKIKEATAKAVSKEGEIMKPKIDKPEISIFFGADKVVSASAISTDEHGKVSVTEIELRDTTNAPTKNIGRWESPKPDQPNWHFHSKVLEIGHIVAGSEKALREDLNIALEGILAKRSGSTRREELKGKMREVVDKCGNDIAREVLRRVNATSFSKVGPDQYDNLEEEIARAIRITKETHEDIEAFEEELAAEATEVAKTAKNEAEEAAEALNASLWPCEPNEPGRYIRVYAKKDRSLATEVVLLVQTENGIASILDGFNNETPSFNLAENIEGRFYGPITEAILEGSSK